MANVYVLQDRSNGYSIDAIILSSLENKEIQKVIDELKTECESDNAEYDYNEDGLTEKFLEVDPYTHIIWLSGATDETYVNW